MEYQAESQKPCSFSQAAAACEALLEVPETRSLRVRKSRWPGLPRHDRTPAAESGTRDVLIMAPAEPESYSFDPPAPPAAHLRVVE